MAVGGYPPATHFLGDLGFTCEVTSDTSARGWTAVGPHVSGADGGARAGVVATLVDVVGGMLGVRILRPDWMATADLTVQLVRPATGPFIEARVELVRRGRSTMVLEALVANVTADGTEVLGSGGSSEPPVAWCTTTFAVLPGGNRTTDEELPFDLPSRMEVGGRGLQHSLVETLDLSVVDAFAGQVSLPVRPYVHNSIGAVQGGAMALLGDVAATEALGAATGLGAGAIVVTDLQVAYLTLGRVGPILSRATVLDGGGTRVGRAAAPGEVLWGPTSAVVELVDAGARDRLTTVINARALPVSEFAAMAPSGAAAT